MLYNFDPTTGSVFKHTNLVPTWTKRNCLQDKRVMHPRLLSADYRFDYQLDAELWMQWDQYVVSFEHERLQSCDYCAHWFGQFWLTNHQTTKLVRLRQFSWTYSNSAISLQQFPMAFSSDVWFRLQPFNGAVSPRIRHTKFGHSYLPNCKRSIRNFLCRSTHQNANECRTIKNRTRVTFITLNQ